jgi:hypothetical protein
MSTSSCSAQTARACSVACVENSVCSTTCTATATASTATNTNDVSWDSPADGDLVISFTGAYEALVDPYTEEESEWIYQEAYRIGHINDTLVTSNDTSTSQGNPSNWMSRSSMQLAAYTFCSQMASMGNGSEIRSLH